MAPSRTPPADDEPLSLDPHVVEDDVELATVVDELVRRSPVAQQRLREVNQLIALLREGVDPDSWRLVLEAESLANQRWADLLLVVARYAFEQGRLHPNPPRDPSPASG